MFGFNYYTPTKVVFGKGTETQVASLVREFGGKKVLIHYGGGSVIRSKSHGQSLRKISLKEEKTEWKTE